MPVNESTLPTSYVFIVVKCLKLLPGSSLTDKWKTMPVSKFPNYLAAKNSATNR